MHIYGGIFSHVAIQITLLHCWLSVCFACERHALNLITVPFDVSSTGNLSYLLTF